VRAAYQDPWVVRNVVRTVLSVAAIAVEVQATMRVE
jgi:hypothetical protein